MLAALALLADAGPLPRNRWRAPSAPCCHCYPARSRSCRPRSGTAGRSCALKKTGSGGIHLGRIGAWQRTGARFGAVGSQLGAVTGALTPEDTAQLVTALRCLRGSYRGRQSRLSLGLATSVFAEVERAELDLLRSPLDAADAPATRVKVPLPGTHRCHVSVRLTIRFRPARDVQIAVLPCYKLPLDGPRRVTPADGRRRLDYRRDLFTEMVWAIRPEQAGNENVDLVVTLNHFYDNLPPQLPAALVADTAADGRVFNRTTADESHRFATISLRLRW